METRGYLIEKAYELFLRHGYAACTFTQLVKGSGLSKGAFYHYFSSKEEIYEAVLKTRFLDYVPSIESVQRAASESLAGLLEQLWRPYAELLDSVQEQYGSVFLYHRFLNEALVLSAALRSEVAARAQELQEALTAHSARLGLAGRVPPSIVFHSLIEGAGVLCALNEDRTPSETFRVIMQGFVDVIES